MFLRRFIGLGALVAIAAAGSATYALAASQEPSPTAASAAVEAAGVSVLDVAYETDPSNPSRVAAVRLRLAAEARGTVVTTLDGGETWIACRARGASLRCPTPGLGVQDAAGLAIRPA